MQWDFLKEDSFCKFDNSAAVFVLLINKFNFSC